ncbi:MAG: hypothetical protein D3924_18625, partial [Candidatus Electrothrix sp. AR4]|nr:hypothetical protein [Candidatus Electrothrix sp. AR4]
SAAEAAFKALGIQSDMSIEQYADDSVLFKCGYNDTFCHILTFPVFLTLASERMVAFAGYIDTGKQNNIQAISAPDRAKLVLNKEKNFTHIFTTTFNDSRKLSGKVSFSSIPKWMGEFRELSLLPISNPLLKSMRSRQWGMVTNVSSFEVKRHIDSFDTIIGRITLTDETDLSNSFISLAFDWLKNNENGGEELVASSTISSTWVSIKGHGIVKQAPLPDYFKDYIAQLPSVKDSSRQLNRNSGIGSMLVSISTQDSTQRKQYFLEQQQFLTSLEDSNLVGNIYYAHYYSWQARVRDKYLFKLLPEIFKQNNGIEFTCVHAEVSHLQEAMPFETIEVSMYLKELFEEGFTLYFEYYSVNGQDKKKKLAHGAHTAICTALSPKTGIIKPITMPEVFMTQFKAMIKK